MFSHRETINSSCDLNYFPKLHAFIRRWEKRLELYSDPISLPTASAGNINLFGVDDLWLAPVVTRWHPSFDHCLENGVKDLVHLLIDIFDCITYSSCQGHPRSETNSDPPIRYVSIVPRSLDEREFLLHCLGEVTCWINGLLPLGLCVAVDLRERKVLTNDGPPIDGLDFVFVPLGNPLDDAYLRDVDVVYRLVCRVLRLWKKVKQPAD